MDWNVQHPQLTMGELVALQHLGQERVVLMRDSHCRVVALCTTLVGHDLEPQPPRHNLPRGRRPAWVDTGPAAWDYAMRCWRHIPAREGEPELAYRQVTDVTQMLMLAAELNERRFLNRERCFGRYHHMWAWAPTDQAEGAMPQVTGGSGNRKAVHLVGFAGHAVFMCGCEVMAATHEMSLFKLRRPPQPLNH